jgi:DNA-binding CsgD family transcriptional regulator
MFYSANIDNSSALEYNISINQKIISLCKPLLDNFGITYFSYSHFFNTGKYLDFCADIKWQQHYIEYFASEPFISKYMKQIYLNRTKYSLWNNDPKSAPEKLFSRFIVDSCNFDIWHGFTIYKHYENSIEAWHFATTKENCRICNFYINNIELLEHFILYFRDRAFEFIDPSDSKKLMTLRDNSPFIDPSHMELELSKNFIENTSIKKYHLSTKNASVTLSRKEAECLFHFSKGRSTKETAKLMNASPRTIETHIENIKRKTGCSRRSDLLSTFSTSGNQHYL